MLCRAEAEAAARAIYYWVKSKHRMYMLVVYPKSRKDDLSDKETAFLRELVKEL